MEKISIILSENKKIIVGSFDRNVFLCKEKAAGDTYKLPLEVIRQLRAKECYAVHIPLDENIVVSEFEDWLINSDSVREEGTEFRELRMRYCRPVLESERIDNKVKKTRKQQKTEQMATIDMHNDNRFCRKCENITGKEPRMNCKSGRFWTGETKVPTRRRVKYYFIAEAPGKEEIEDSEGRFLVGRSGREFGGWLYAAGLDEKFVYVDNTIRCALRTDVGFLSTQNRNTLIENCKVYLFNELSRLKPDVIIPVGRTAIQALLGVSNITKWMGRTIVYPKLNCWVVPIMHPAAVLRGRTWERQNIINILSELPLLTEKKPQLKLIKDIFVLEDRQFDLCLSELEKASEIEIDTETVGSDERGELAQIIGLCLSCHLTRGYFVPLWDFKYITEEDGDSKLGWDFKKPKWSVQQIRRLKRLLKDRKKLKVFHHAGFDFNWLEFFGFDIPMPIYDTLIGSSVLDYIDNGLKDLSWIHTTFGGYEEELENVPGLKKSRMDLVDPFVLARYGAYDAIATKNIKVGLDRICEIHPAKKLIPSLMEMRYNLSKAELLGCRIDLKKVKELKKEYEEKLKELQKELFSLLKVKELNLNSNVQLVRCLYGDAGLFQGMVAKPSTDKRVLEDLKRTLQGLKVATRKQVRQLRVIELILDYRKYSKFISTYLNMFLERHDENGRIHPHFTLHVARTGRLTSKDPNLQNIPRVGGIRDCFIASPGNVLWELDYSQLELRLAAECSLDERMLEILNDPEGDIHSQVGVASIKMENGEDYPISEFHSGELRAKAKIISFSTIYGKTLRGLAHDLNCTLQEAAKIFNFFFSNFTGLKNFVDMQHAFVREHGYVTTLFGRCIRIDGAQSHVQEEIEAAYRKSVNYPIQSPASDVVVMAYNRLSRRIKKEKWPAKIILTVHDSILFDGAKSFKKEGIALAKEEMERPIPQIKAVKLYADAKAGYRWGTMKEVKKIK